MSYLHGKLIEIYLNVLSKDEEKIELIKLGVQLGNALWGL